MDSKISESLKWQYNIIDLCVLDWQMDRPIGRDIIVETKYIRQNSWEGLNVVGIGKLIGLLESIVGTE